MAGKYEQDPATGLLLPWGLQDQLREQAQRLSEQYVSRVRWEPGLTIPAPVSQRPERPLVRGDLEYARAMFAGEPVGRPVSMNEVDLDWTHARAQAVGVFFTTDHIRGRLLHLREKAMIDPRLAVLELECLLQALDEDAERSIY